MAPRYYVVGGEYADTSFTVPAAGAELETHGPFSEREAKVCWRALTGKTVDNAMVRYFLKPEDQIAAGDVYSVVGGEYADSSFTRPAPGKEIEVYGPFNSWDEAQTFWRGLTSKSIDDALVRYDVRKNYHAGDFGGGSAPVKAPAVRTKTKSVAIAAPPSKVFRFLADVSNWPRWAIYNIKSLKPAGAGWDVETPQGRGRLSLDSDERSGVLDHVFEDAAGVRWVVPSRVVPGGDGAVMIMTFLKPSAMSESEFATAMSQTDDELATLKRALEAK